MNITRKAIYLALIFVVAAAAAPKKPQTFHLVVEGLGASVPARFTCAAGGVGISPPLSWSGEPAGTQSFALIVDDLGGAIFPGNPEPYIHWTLWDIPASIHSLEEGAKEVGVTGKEYEGPCPPPGGGAHLYVFRMFALDLPSLNLKRGKSKDALEDAMRRHVLGKAEFRLPYGR